MNGQTTAATIQVETSAELRPSVPNWFGEIVLLAQYWKQQGVLTAIEDQVRLARRRFGTYEVIDFVVMLLGYASRGERTLKSYSERVQPFKTALMGLFERAEMPHRSTLSRFRPVRWTGAVFNEGAVEALRRLFVADLLARPVSPEGIGGLWDRAGQHWVVFDVDGTRQAARQRALPHPDDRPAAQRRLVPVCQPGYLGRKRGEVVRTRTTVAQSHTHQWLGTFGGSGNGDYRGQLKRAAEVIGLYLTAEGLSVEQGIVRLDGLYGNGALVEDIVKTGLNYLMRGQDYHLLDLPIVQERLTLPPDQQTTHPETGIQRALFDFPALSLTPTGQASRVIVAAHPATATPSPIGVTRDGIVYELFFTGLPPQGFTPTDVLDCYSQRGAFETLLADEDQAQDPDRWCSHTPCGQECWQILSQWVWNLRLELGQQLHPTSFRLTELAPALPPPPPPIPTPSPVIYSSPQWARPAQMGGFPGQAFLPQPDGPLRCPADHPLYPQERRPERNGSLRVLYAARIAYCRAGDLRAQCQGYGVDTRRTRRVSAVLWPLDPQPALLLEPPSTAAALPLLWRDWPPSRLRRDWLALLRTQSIRLRPMPFPSEPPPRARLTRPQRAHWRLSWVERLQRNAARGPTVFIRLFGIPPALAHFLGLPVV
jgi:hypothetical protein